MNVVPASQLQLFSSGPAVHGECASVQCARTLQGGDTCHGEIDVVLVERG